MKGHACCKDLLSRPVLKIAMFEIHKKAEDSPRWNCSNFTDDTFK